MALFVLCLVPALGYAQRTLQVPAVNGNPLFDFTIYDKGEGGAPSRVSTWTLSPEYVDTLGMAANYWANLLGHLPVNKEASPGYVFTSDIVNASAGSDFIDNGYTYLTQNLLLGKMAEGSHGSIEIGKLFSHAYDLHPITVLPLNNDTPLSITLVHELGHVMGIYASVDNLAPADFHFHTTKFTNWSLRLVDSYGTPMQLGMPVRTGYSPLPGTFVVRPNNAGEYDYIYFRGPQTLAVLGPSYRADGHNIPGLPVESLETTNYSPVGYVVDFSHSELRNSLMSHQFYSNWGILMEAELAAMQDIGIPLDRKNFFGSSIYEDNITSTITQGFSARNIEGTAYLAGVHNATPTTVGLHIYGSNNATTLAADLLSSGYGSAGIRIDGNNNTLSIRSRVHAHGQDSSALLVAYGRQQNIRHTGELASRNGTAARFDFGNNLLGNWIEYRGSFIHQIKEVNVPLLPELQAPLVENFDVTGTLYGGQAAIYIAPNAFVKNIHIMQGSALYGDIISDWDTENPLLQKGHLTSNDLRTQLSFGLLANADGSATNQADPDFALAWRGNMISPASIDLRLAGGTLAWSGQMHTNHFEVAPGAALGVLPAFSPAQIDAAEISFANASRLYVAGDGYFFYSPPLQELRHTLLELHGNLDFRGTLVENSGVFGAGMYDYAFFDPSLELNNTGGALSVKLGTPHLSHQRAATLASSAPLALAVHNNFGASLTSYMARRFGGLYTDTAGAGNAVKIEAASTQNDGKASQDSYTFWFAPSYGHSRYRGDFGYQINSPALAMGLDRGFGEKLFAGLAFGIAQPDFSSDDADIQSSDFSGALYAGFVLPQKLEFGLFGAMTRQYHEQRRHVHQESYHTRYAANLYNLGAGLARDFALSTAWSVRPYVSYEYLHLNTQGYNEDPGLYALHADRTRHNLYRLRSGAELAWQMNKHNLIKIGGFYSGLYGDFTSKTILAFAHDPAGNIHQTIGQALDKHSGGVNTLLDLQLHDRIALTGSYTFMAGKNSWGHEISAMLKISF